MKQSGTLRPRRVALVLLPLTLLATVFLALRSRHPGGDAFGVDGGPMITIATEGAGASIQSVLLKTSDPRAQAFLDVLRRHTPASTTSFSGDLTLRGAGKEIEIDRRAGLVRDRDALSAIDAKEAEDALANLSPELRAGLPSSRKTR